MGVVAALGRSEPRLLEMRPAARPLRWLWGAVGLLILLTPIGALAPGTAWGEWSDRQLKELVGYVPTNLGKLGGLWRARMPGYSTPGVGSKSLGYFIAAVVGAALCVALAWGVGAVLARRHAGRSFARRTADSIAHHVSEVLENEEVAARPGLLQSLDPRVKLLTLLVFAVTASLVHALWLLIVLVGVTLVLAAISRVSVGSFARKVWGSAGLLALLIALPSSLAFFTPGRVVLAVGPFSFTAPGIMGAATLVARVAAAAGFALLIVWTMRWSGLLHALTALRVPDVVVATLAMTQRHILTLLRTVEQIHLARESRTLTTGTTKGNRAWVTERMAFVVRKSMKTADDVYDAMLSRGFSGAMPALAHLRLRARDWAWSAAALAVCAAALYADRIVRLR